MKQQLIPPILHGVYDLMTLFSMHTFPMPQTNCGLLIHHISKCLDVEMLDKN
jgi:hypothetical protein